MNNFGKKLKEKRREAGFSQRKLAEIVGVDFSYISKLENGRLPPPAAATVVRMAEILGCSDDELLAAARKLPMDVENVVTEQPGGLRFLREASKLRLTQGEWEQMIGELHNLRNEREEGMEE